MAQRRAIGEGIGAGISGFGNAISDLGMKNFESALIQKRQQELAQQNQEAQLREKALADPNFASRLPPALRTKLGIPETTGTDLQGGIMDLINKAKNPTDLPTNEQMAASDTMQGGQFSTNGGKDFTNGQVPVGIDEILARTRARDSKQAQFGAQPKMVEYVNPQGVKTQEQTTVEGAQGMAQPVERNTTQEANRSGAVAGANAAAQARYGTSVHEGTDPTGQPAFGIIDKHTNSAQIVPGFTPTPKAGQGGAMTPAMKSGIARLKSSLSMLQTLDPALTQQQGFEGRWEGTKQRIGNTITGANSRVSLYDGISSALLPALARTSGEVGNLAEQEQTRYQKLAPQVNDPVNVRRAKYQAIQYMIDAAANGKTAVEMLPFLDYMQFAGEAAGLGATVSSMPGGQGGPTPPVTANPTTQVKSARQLLEEARQRGATGNQPAR